MCQPYLDMPGGWKYAKPMPLTARIQQRAVWNLTVLTCWELVGVLKARILAIDVDEVLCRCAEAFVQWQHSPQGCKTLTPI
eukprot:s624_g2.t1